MILAQIEIIKSKEIKTKILNKNKIYIMNKENPKWEERVNPNEYLKAIKENVTITENYIIVS